MAALGFSPVKIGPYPSNLSPQEPAPSAPGFVLHGSNPPDTDMEALGFPRKPHIDRAAKPYLRWDVSGEGWVTIGLTVIHAKKGFDGIVETLPFTCIPEIAALNILPRVSRDYNIPVISFIFDEQSGRAGMRTRLEAFVDLLKRRQALRPELAGS